MPVRRASAKFQLPLCRLETGGRRLWFACPPPRGTDPGAARRDFGHGVLEQRLAGSSHDQQVTRRGPKVHGPSPAQRPQEERPGCSQGNDGDDGVVQVPELSVRVEGNAVAAIAVVVEAGATRGTL